MEKQRKIQREKEHKQKEREAKKVEEEAKKKKKPRVEKPSQLTDCELTAESSGTLKRPLTKPR